MRKEQGTFHFISDQHVQVSHFISPAWKTFIFLTVDLNTAIILLL